MPVQALLPWNTHTKSPGLHLAIDLFMQQEIHPDEGMDPRTHLLTCLSDFKGLSDTI